jgi:UDP-glucose 4-epimerase
MSKTIIVTGGCGYIGSHVARAFKQLDANNKVYIVDRLRFDNTLKDIDGFVQADYASVNSLSFIAEKNPDIIVHCAGTSLVGPSVIDPSDYYSNNVSKTISLLNFLKDRPKKPVIIFSSSASVYGDPKEVPITEDHPVNPISPYGNTKLIIEKLLADYSNAYGISSVCFRYFNAAGAWPVESDLGQPWGATHIVARALEASLKHLPFTLNGKDFPTPDGTCIRDYIHVMDLATAHLKAAIYIESSPGAHIFNLGTNKGTSNQEIVDYVKLHFGIKNIQNGPRRAGDPAELVADATRANKELTWEPTCSTIEDIIRDAYKWYCNQPQY